MGRSHALTLHDGTNAFASSRRVDLDALVDEYAAPENRPHLRDRHHMQRFELAVDSESICFHNLEGDLMGHTLAPAEFVYNYAKLAPLLDAARLQLLRLLRLRADRQLPC